MSLLHLCNIDKYLFKVHLKFHQKALELDGLSEGHRLTVDVDTSFLQYHGGFRHLKDAETHLAEHEGELGQGRGLAGTWTASQADSRNRQLRPSLTGLPDELLLQTR